MYGQLVEETNGTSRIEQKWSMNFHVYEQNLSSGWLMAIIFLNSMISYNRTEVILVVVRPKIQLWLFRPEFSLIRAQFQKTYLYETGGRKLGEGFHLSPTLHIEIIAYGSSKGKRPNGSNLWSVNKLKCDLCATRPFFTTKKRPLILSDYAISIYFIQTIRNSS